MDQITRSIVEAERARDRTAAEQRQAIWSWWKPRDREETRERDRTVKRLSPPGCETWKTVTHLDDLGVPGDLDEACETLIARARKGVPQGRGAFLIQLLGKGLKSYYAERHGDAVIDHAIARRLLVPSGYGRSGTKYIAHTPGSRKRAEAERAEGVTTFCESLVSRAKNSALRERVARELGHAGVTLDADAFEDADGQNEARVTLTITQLTKLVGSGVLADARHVVLALAKLCARNAAQFDDAAQVARWRKYGAVSVARYMEELQLSPAMADAFAVVLDERITTELAAQAEKEPA